VFKTGEIVERPIQSEDGNFHYLARLLPYRDFEKATQGVVATFVDVTALNKTQAHQQVLIAELNHRVKNMITVVLTIAEQTIKSSPSLDSFKAAYLPRVQAMARSYELLSRENWTEAALDDVVRQEFIPFGTERVKIAGPGIRLKPAQALSLGIILHELATNAGKYGALSKAIGSVTVNWQSVGDRVHLIWQEQDGPTVVSPKKRGFGLKLVEGEASYYLGGKCKISFESLGLRAELDIQMDEGKN
jgi:two-component system CheB/CheR fusion protein